MGSGPIVAVEGPSAAGKTTVTSVAGGRPRAAMVPEAFVRLGRPLALEFDSSIELVRTERGLFREDVRRWADAVRLARRGRTVYLDTGALGTLTYTWGLVQLGRARPDALDAVLASIERAARSGRIGLPDRTAYLDPPALTRRQRARSDPEGHPPESDSLYERVGREERNVWLERWAPLFGSRFARLDGRGSVGRIAEQLTRLGSRPRARSGAGRSREDRDLLLALLRNLAR